ncbi:MAG: NAD(P)-dependent oxidoreductase [Euzebyaceae bacterium]|nr:NAD(P)-dependent oxidoreductase [Euzebyaceae bacterium]
MLLGAGMAVRVWNRTAVTARPLAADGATVATRPQDAVEGADVVLTMLSDGGAVEEVMAGGALAAMDDAAVWLQMSTVGLEATERLPRLAGERGVGLVDAPVLGTRGPAEKGQLLVLASGPPQCRERCDEVFDAVAARTMWLGPAGEGNRLKLVVNAWLLGLVGALAETIALARAVGADPERFLEAIDGGPVGVPYARLKGRAMIDGDFPTSFPLRLAGKDLGLVREAAAAAGQPLPVADALAAQVERAVAAGHGDEDLAAIVRA